jgi:hypothetical protein
MIGRLLGALPSLARALRRRRGDYGDDAVTLFCRYCHREPGGECTCRKDCGRPDCLWPLWNTLRTDDEISAWLGKLKGEDVQ